MQAQTDQGSSGLALRSLSVSRHISIDVQTLGFALLTGLSDERRRTWTTAPAST